MSSILASLDMSLDDLIAQKKTRNSNPDARPAKKDGRGDAGGAGPVRGRRNRQRNQPYSRSKNNDDDDGMDVDDDDVPAKSGGGKKRSVEVKAPGKGKGGKNGSSILSRLGSNTAKSAQTQQGTKILVKNLKYDILEDDVGVLFGTVGKVAKAEIVYDRSGRSKGIARVWFERRADAEKAIKQYDGRTLDGQPMHITLDADSNVRQGLFGTALRDDDNGVKFKVSFGNNSRDESKGRSGGDRSGSGRRRGGRGGRRGGAGGEKPAEKTAQDLDNEMDTYMKDA